MINNQLSIFKKRPLVLFLLFSLFSLLLSYIVVVKVKKNKPQNQVSSIPSRAPAVAGSFYPSDSRELDTKIQTLLNEATVASAEGRLSILIVPHAGIEFSGAVAAAGFKQVENRGYSRIIILGASHRSLFDYAAVYDKGVWLTPLGKIGIDEDLAGKLLDKQQKILADEQPHKDEHSLEIELIFLQKVLKNFKIVPILVSQTDEQLLSSLAEKIAENLDEQTFLVISSDLSHYPSWEIANKVDKETINGILSGQAAIFEQTLRKLESQHYPSLDTCACGEKAIAVGLKVAEILKITDFKLIKYENSGDVSKDLSRVVGYAAIGGWLNKNSNSVSTLDEKAQNEALAIARKTLEEYLKSPISPISLISLISPKNKSLLDPLGCFVTLRNNGELRGCIGTFEPKDPLYQVIQEMVIAAATEDYRFPTVQKEELSAIKIEISVMTPKKKIDDWKKIELGKQGVVVQKGARSGTFLPQVATETGWNLEEFLGQLCSQKAGLASDCYKDPSVTLYTFKAQVFEEK